MDLQLIPESPVCCVTGLCDVTGMHADHLGLHQVCTLLEHLIT